MCLYLFIKGTFETSSLDHLGAIWHEADADIRIKEYPSAFTAGNPALDPTYTFNIFANLRDALQPDGVIIVDGQSNENSTGSKIDLATEGQPIPGFRRDTIKGEGSLRLRVYQRV